MTRSEITGMNVNIGHELAPLYLYLTFLPLGLKIIGSSVVSQSLRRIVVLPALARPITRIRNCLNLARVLLIASAVSLGWNEVDIWRKMLMAQRC